MADVAIEPYAVTHHFNPSPDTNENHNYFGLVYRYDKFELGGFTMKNSHNAQTNAIYVGYRQDLYTYKKLELGVFGDIGYRTGYDTNLLLYVGGYVEYSNLYIKIAANPSFIGGTIGYIFRF